MDLGKMVSELYNLSKQLKDKNIEDYYIESSNNINEGIVFTSVGEIDSTSNPKVLTKIIHNIMNITRSYFKSIPELKSKVNIYSNKNVIIDINKNITIGTFKENNKQVQNSLIDLNDTLQDLYGNNYLLDIDNKRKIIYIKQLNTLKNEEIIMEVMI